ncbi:hypothetical protein J3B02_003175 [Coemansia erecta]|nr:hypothetical protein J3B02_003175 [Coemansia erecta]
MEFALYCLDTFESIMLSFVWEYQGENILQFLFKHQYVQAGTLVINKTSSNRTMQAGNVQARGVQTEAAEANGISTKQRSTRDALIDKMLEDLVPALLHALHEMPKRNELAELAHEQTQLVKSIYEKQQKLMADHNQPDNGHSDIVAPVLQLLISRVNAVDTRLFHVLSKLDSSKDGREINAEVDNRLKPLIESLGAVKAKYEADRILAAEVMQSLANLDKVISTTAVPKRHADAWVETESFISILSESASNASSSLAAPLAKEDCDNPIEQGTDVSSQLSAENSCLRSDNNSICSIKSSPRNISPGADSTNEDRVPLVTIERVVSTSSSDQDPVPFAKEKIPSDTTLRKVHYYKSSIKNTSSKDDDPAHVQGTKNRSSRRFSLKNGIRRHSWFGKKAFK